MAKGAGERVREREWALGKVRGMHLMCFGEEYDPLYEPVSVKRLAKLSQL